MDVEMGDVSSSTHEGGSVGQNTNSDQMAATFFNLNRILTERFHMTPIDAAVKSIEMLQHGPPFLVNGEDVTASVFQNVDSGATTGGGAGSSQSATSPALKQTQALGDSDEKMEETTERPASAPETKPIESSSRVEAKPKPASSLSLDSLRTMVSQARESGDSKHLRDQIYQAFSVSENLNASFLSAEGGTTAMVDLDAVDEAYSLILGLEMESLTNSLRYALETLLASVHYKKYSEDQKQEVNQLLIIMECPLLLDPDYHKSIVAVLLAVIFNLPAALKEELKARWSGSRDRFVRILSTLQQFITVRIYIAQGSTANIGLPEVMCACSLISLLHEINLEKGYVGHAEFYNDAVNSEIHVVQDYKRWRTRGTDDTLVLPANGKDLSPEQLAFCDFPYMLDAAVKAKVLQLDARVQMRAELQDAMIRTLLLGHTSPYLFLRVHRENIIQDTLQQIAAISARNKNDLKKPLKVQFVDEEGVDEGGVQKEFFQILIRQLLDPAYAMFIYDDESRTLWFNSHSLESSMEFELIGILMGIAIYNGVILDVHFPMVLYKRLLGIKPLLSDLIDAKPSLGKGLQNLLDFDGDVESTFSLTFEIQQEVFGEIFTVELKDNGGSIPVTKENREEFVQLYVEYVLEKAVERQYKAFHNGFHMVAGGEILKMFVADELELLICGSRDLDFEALERVTHYEDGYTRESRCIQWFWSVVHEMTIEEKKKLLSFCTGSDRVPINGLSSLTFIISRNGGDSDRLPTAHTCFNHLLLPDYTSRDKLKDRLLLAVNQAEGFGLM